VIQIFYGIFYSDRYTGSMSQQAKIHRVYSCFVGVFCALLLGYDNSRVIHIALYDASYGMFALFNAGDVPKGYSPCIQINLMINQHPLISVILPIRRKTNFPLLLFPYFGQYP